MKIYTYLLLYLTSTKALAGLHAYIVRPQNSIELLCVSPMKKKEVCQVAKLQSDKVIESKIIEKDEAVKIMDNYAKEILKHCASIHDPDTESGLSWNIEHGEIKTQGSLLRNGDKKSKICTLTFLGLESELIRVLK